MRYNLISIAYLSV